jgi:Macrocin-O-methyltransferase (TylF)
MAKSKGVGQFSMSVSANQTSRDAEYLTGLASYFDQGIGDTIDKLRSFPKFIPNSALGKFLCRYELFKEILPVHGAIVECGVHLGGGVMTWAQFSAIYEPFNHVRKIVGFDTFAGFAGVNEKDIAAGVDASGKGTFAAPAYEDLQRGIEIFDLGRPLGHIPKVELVKGDALKTIPAYVAANQHLVVAMLYLDFDVYEPTKVALETLRSRMPKGAVIVFDELYNHQWPGETLAVLETIGISNLRIKRFPHQPQISYAVIE